MYKVKFTHIKSGNTFFELYFHAAYAKRVVESTNARFDKHETTAEYLGKDK